jgi:hypothetical protein
VEDSKSLSPTKGENMSDTIPCQCSAILKTELRADGKTYLVKEDLEHLLEHYQPDHKELKEQEEQTKLIEELI